MTGIQRGRFIVLTLLALSLGLVALEVLKHVYLGPFGAGAYLFAAALLSALLVRPTVSTRRALIGMLVVYVVCGAGWWAFAPAELSVSVLVGAGWLVGLPALFVLLLSSRSVSAFLAVEQERVRVRGRVV